MITKVRKYTAEEVEKLMIREGVEPESPFYWTDVAEQFRECYSCAHYVRVDDQSENCCDQCAGEKRGNQ